MEVQPEDLAGALRCGYAFCDEDADEIVAAVKKVTALELQNEVLQKDLAAAHEILKARDTRADDANRLVGELQKALAEAVQQIREHNNEYVHVTPKEKLAQWKQLSTPSEKRKDGCPKCGGILGSPDYGCMCKRVDRCQTCGVEIPPDHCRYTKGDLDYCGGCGVPK